MKIKRRFTKKPASVNAFYQAMNFKDGAVFHMISDIVYSNDFRTLLEDAITKYRNASSPTEKQKVLNGFKHELRNVVAMETIEVWGIEKHLEYSEQLANLLYPHCERMIKNNFYYLIEIVEDTYIEAINKLE